MALFVLAQKKRFKVVIGTTTVALGVVRMGGHHRNVKMGYLVKFAGLKMQHITVRLVLKRSLGTVHVRPLLNF